MNKLLEFIKEKRFDLIVITILVVLLFAAVPYVIHDSINTSIASYMEPINNKIEQMDNRLTSVENKQTEDLTSRGIAAYKKVFTIDDLQENTQNAVSIQLALEDQKARNILLNIDSARTLMFEDYFAGRKGLGSTD